MTSETRNEKTKNSWHSLPSTLATKPNQAGDKEQQQNTHTHTHTHTNRNTQTGKGRHKQRLSTQDKLGLQPSPSSMGKTSEEGGGETEPLTNTWRSNSDGGASSGYSWVWRRRCQVSAAVGSWETSSVTVSPWRTCFKKLMALCKKKKKKKKKNRQKREGGKRDRDRDRGEEGREKKREGGMDEENPQPMWT